MPYPSRRKLVWERLWLRGADFCGAELVLVATEMRSVLVAPKMAPKTTRMGVDLGGRIWMPEASFYAVFRRFSSLVVR